MCRIQKSFDENIGLPAAQVEQTVRAPDEVYCPAPHAVWPVAAEPELAMYPAAAAVH